MYVQGGWGGKPSRERSHIPPEENENHRLKSAPRRICDRSQEGISHQPRVLYKSILATCVREVRNFDLRLPKSGVVFQCFSIAEGPKDSTNVKRVLTVYNLGKLR